MRPIAEIHLEHLLNNFNYINSYIGNSKIIGVVKANAYGHGLIKISQTLEKAGIYGLSVAIAEELLLLRNSKVNVPVLHLGVLDYDNLEIYQYKKNICTINSIDDIYAIKRFISGEKKRIFCHLKFDTGMGRLGIDYNKAEDILKLIKDIDGICLSGIYSHFSSSDENDDTFMQLQLNRFRSIIKIADYLIPEQRDYHISNSTGIK